MLVNLINKNPKYLMDFLRTRSVQDKNVAFKVICDPKNEFYDGITENSLFIIGCSEIIDITNQNTYEYEYIDGSEIEIALYQIEGITAREL